MDSVRRKVSNRVYSGETEDLKFNQASGADKVIPAGHHLKPIFIGANTFSTNATTRLSIGRGVTLAVFNNAATVSTITIGDSTVTSQGAGLVQAGTEFVGIPLKPYEYTYLNTFDKEYVITSAATALVYIVEDDTNITQVK